MEGYMEMGGRGYRNPESRKPAWIAWTADCFSAGVPWRNRPKSISCEDSVGEARSGEGVVREGRSCLWRTWWMGITRVEFGQQLWIPARAPVTISLFKTCRVVKRGVSGYADTEAFMIDRYRHVTQRFLLIAPDPDINPHLLHVAAARIDKPPPSPLVSNLS